MPADNVDLRPVILRKLPLLHIDTGGAKWIAHLYDQWTDMQRAQLRSKLTEGAQYIICLIREQRLSPYNVFLYNSPFQALMAAAIALYGEDHRGEPLMAFTYDLLKHRVLPVWEQVMRGGPRRLDRDRALISEIF